MSGGAGSAAGWDSNREPHPRTFVYPNRNCLGLGALLLAMWYAGASQSNGAAYLLCFVLVALACVSTLHAWSNVRQLRVGLGTIEPVFAGEEIQVPLLVRSSANRPRAALRFKISGGQKLATVDLLPPEQEAQVSAAAPATRRGSFDEVSVIVSSIYPLGFFTARQRLKLSRKHFIYPALNGGLPLPVSAMPASERREGVRVEGDDFAGTRAYQTGESQRHIDWKAAARGQPLLIKQWAGEADEIFHFTWDDAPQLALESRLSQLAQWIVTAERRGASYGLRLPGTAVAPRSGPSHFHECLRALAVFQQEDGRT